MTFHNLKRIISTNRYECKILNIYWVNLIILSGLRKNQKDGINLLQVLLTNPKIDNPTHCKGQEFFVQSLSVEGLLL
jgi:hypothetical protein